MKLQATTSKLQAQRADFGQGRIHPLVASLTAAGAGRARGGLVKIALVSPYDLSVPGGVNSHIHHLSDHFTALGHDVRLIAPASDLTNIRPNSIVVGASGVHTGRRLDCAHVDVASAGATR